MPPSSKSNLGESSKKSKLNLKITQDDHRLTIDLVDKTANQDQSSEPLSDSILIESPFQTESLGLVNIRPKKKSKNNCLNIFEKRQTPKPYSDSYKNLKEIITQANESWSHFFLPLIHFGNIDPNREKVNQLLENFKQKQNLISTPRNETVQLSASQISNVDSNDIRLLSSFEEKNSSSSSASHSVRSKFNKLDALKTEIDKTINEINTFKNEVLYNESVKPNQVQTTEIGINTEISMSNAVFKIKYEDEEDEDEIIKNQTRKDIDKTNYSHADMPFIESPSDTNSYNKPKRNDLPALTLIKNLNKKYNLNSINDSDLSSTGTSIKNSITQPKSKISYLESDSLDNYKLKHNKNYALDDNNIFKKIFSRNLEKDDHGPSYINLEPLRKRLDSSSGLSSSNSEIHEPKRVSKTFKKRDSWLNEERKRHSLKKLPVYDFGPSASKRNSSEYKLNMAPLKKSLEQTKFHCCCCKCSCKDIPVYKTIITTTTTKIPISPNIAESSTDESVKSSDKSTGKSQNLASYYFKSINNQRKKNEFGLSSQVGDHDVNKKKFDNKYFMLDSLEERGNGVQDDEYLIYKNLINNTESTSDEDFDRIQTNIQYILDSLHRPHSAFQCNQDRINNASNFNEFETSKNQQNNMVIFYL